MPILQRSCHLHSCWLIAINLSDSATPQKYHLTRDVYECSSLRQPSFSQNCIIQKLSDENYLGRSSFSDELHCSFHKFIAIIVSTLGYLPLRVDFNEEE
jgi:hypothetical protein